MATDEGPPPPDTQRALLHPLLTAPLTIGGTAYPISFKWLEVWKAYVGFEEGSVAGGGAPPEQIDNEGLTGELEGTLKKGIRDNYDYELICEEAWKKLSGWYGGGPAFARPIAERQFLPFVELYPQPCKVQFTDATGEPSGDEKIILAPRDTTGSKLLAKIAPEFGTTAQNGRLWVKPLDDGAKYSLMNPIAKLEEVARDDEFTYVLLDIKNASGWARAEATPEDEAGLDGEFDEEAWRAGLVADSKLDARDHEKKWYESRVVEVQPEGTDPASIGAVGTSHDVSGPGDLLKVHFMGWDSKWDSWYCRSSAGLQPLNTKVRKWRDFRATDKVEMKVDGRWHMAKVEEIDREGRRVKLRPSVDRTLGDRWFEFDSDLLAEAHTHIKQRQTRLTNYTSYRSHTKGTPSVGGAVGLNNLGNTCFMNSMLQCLSNTQPLTQFFLSDAYKEEINTDNVLGCGGHLAEAYGQLMKDMWGGEYTVVCPTDFKLQIGTKAPQFAGYQQQDSQELMSFLMDGLHEDLNRVLKKPYTEDVESKGRPDLVVAREAWEMYLKRNDSIIADIFGGQLKSHVSCNLCDRESVTFDPFLSISVPLPVKNERTLTFTYLASDGAPPMRFKAVVPKQGVIEDIKRWFQATTGIPSTELILGDVYLWKVFRFLPAQRALSDIRDNDVIWMYHTPEAPGAAAVKEERKKMWEELAAKRRAERVSYGRPFEPPAENERDCVVCMIRGEKKNVHYNPRFGGAPTRYDGIADPHIISLPACAGSYEENPTGKQLHDAIYRRLTRFVLESVRDDFNPETPPYKLNIINKSLAGAVTEIPYDDTPVEVKADQMLAADWDIEAVAASFDAPQVRHCDFHDSTKEDLAKAEGMTLDQCFDQFGKREQLGEADMWYCASCKEHRRAYKEMSLFKAPSILIVHLKRFQYSQGTFFVHRDKLDNLVQFPLEGLDLTERLPAECRPETGLIYDLFAVSNHAGGLGGGHYTAYVKNFKDGEWYDANDSHMSRADPARIVSRQAYVLFYQLRGTDRK